MKLINELESEQKYQKEILEIISETKHIKGQIKELDFMQTYPIELIKTKHDNFIKTDFEPKNIKKKIQYNVGAIYYFECKNTPLKKYYIRFLGFPYGISISQKEFDFLVNSAKSYYYQNQ